MLADALAPMILTMQDMYIRVMYETNYHVILQDNICFDNFYLYILFISATVLLICFAEIWICTTWFEAKY